MMIPSVIAPPALYPGLYRPTAALPSTFPGHSSFLVEDLLRISRPAAFLNRTVPPVSASLPAATSSASYHGAPAERAFATAAVTREPCSPKTSKDPSFLKFGVSAILAPSPKTSEWKHTDLSRSRLLGYFAFMHNFIYFNSPLIFFLQHPHLQQSTVSIPRHFLSPALMEPSTPYSGHHISQVGAIFMALCLH